MRLYVFIRVSVTLFLYLFFCLLQFASNEPLFFNLSGGNSPFHVSRRLRHRENWDAAQLHLAFQI